MPGFCSTEMISAHDLVYRHSNPKRFLQRDQDEGLLCFQLAAKDPEVLSKAVEIVEKSGADLIDLNCGCPVQKIRKKNMGSKLLDDPESLFHLIKVMRDQTDAVLSIKIRISEDNNIEHDKAVIDAAQSAGANFIIVHGRTWKERYDVDCQYARIKVLVQYAQIPIFANGDVNDYKSLEKLYEQTGCSGVMISRASVGKPWLFAELFAVNQKKQFDQPKLPYIGSLFLEHVRGLIALQNERVGVLQSRKLAKYYAQHLHQGKHEFVLRAQQMTTLDELIHMVNEWFIAYPLEQV